MWGKLVWCVTCKFMSKERVDTRELKRQQTMHQRSNGDTEKHQEMEREYQLKKLLKQNSEEQ